MLQGRSVVYAAVAVAACASIEVFIRWRERKTVKEYKAAVQPAVQERNERFRTALLSFDSFETGDGGGPSTFFSMTARRTLILPQRGMTDFGLFEVATLYHDNIIGRCHDEFPLVADLWNCLCLAVNRELVRFNREPSLLNVDLDGVMELVVVASLLSSTFHIQHFFANQVVSVDTIAVDATLLAESYGKLSAITARGTGMRVMVGNLVNLSNAQLLVAMLGLSSLERCLAQLLPQPRSPFVLMEKGSGVGFAQCAKGICAFYATAALTQVLFSLIAGEKKWVASRVSYAYKLAVVRDTTLRLCECPYDHPRVDHFHTKIMHIMFACSNLDIGALEGYVDYYWSLVSKARVVLELPVEYVVSRFARQFTRTRERAMRHTELLVHALEDSANETKAAIEPVHYGLLLLLCAAHGHDASPWPSLSRLALYTGCPVESATCLKLYGALCRSITECGPFTEAEQQWLAAMHQEAMRVLQTDTRVARNERNAFYRKLSVDERRDLLLSDDTVSPPDPTPLPRPPLSVRQWKAALLSSFGVFATAFLGSLPFYATLLSLSRRRTTLGDSIAETEETNAKLATLCANHGHAVEVDDLYRTPTLFSLAYSETLSTVKNDTMWMNFGLQVIREFSHAEFPPAALHPPPAPWRIRFERVSFRYPRATSPALDDVSFEVIGGQFCGIVGFNGSGKSTIFKLLTRLYEPQSGTIYLNGIPLRDFSRRELNRSAASAWYSTNEMRFLPLSLEENIGLGNIAATGEEVRAALDHVEGGALAGRSGNAVFHAEHFSSGEVEKLNLSRVFVKPGAPSVGLYLLDEATRSLDSVTEEKVLRRIRDFRSTFILITHRLSTLKEADTILVFRSGKLVESGSWTSLTRKGVHTYFQQLLH